MIKNEILKGLISQLKDIQSDFFKNHGSSDIFSNSKIYEILIANELGHSLLPKLSGGRDAKDCDGGEVEYKHFKETSSNHTWTFNDFTDSTIEKLRLASCVVFAHIDDTKEIPYFDWYYLVPSGKVSDYLAVATLKIQNHRKMINVGCFQIENNMGIKKSLLKENFKNGRYSNFLLKILEIIREIEKITGIKQILTSNKFWEMLVSLKTGHQIQSEQAGHDAEDEQGNMYEYKVSKNSSWNFQDISDNVLNKYLKDKEIILAIVDKKEMKVLKIYSAPPKIVVKTLIRKLEEKKKKFELEGKILRRLQVSLTAGDLPTVKAKLIYADTALGNK
ncbi:MAG: hypothetical protein NT155_00725 [Candidatus Staskawiczbacteria bacterium]|nr:hypothetical protein [Candidatus Staskawiczbacteria bacterium]